MSELYLMATISDRNQSRRFLAFYKEYGISVTFLTLGRGTAAVSYTHLTLPTTPYV